MANSIDERIVEMRFDNKDFERGVSSTIDSLDKLKKGLDFEDSVKGFDELDKAAGKVNLNPLEKSVEAVKVQFNALEVIAITALSKITNQAIDAGEKLVKSFTLDPIMAGFDKYESKVASVQRILNSSSDNTMESVEAALAKIEWFTNETSYQYDQMVSTLGSFAASGIELKDATNMIVGIADAAAISGVNAKDASHAMLGFQRAISSGYLSLGIWNSYLKTAGMQSQVFIDKCIEMGLKTGTLRKNLKGVAETAKGTEVTLASFASTLNEKWLDADTLTETTKAFSIASDELYAIMQNEDFDMVGDAIDKYGDKLDQFSLKAFKAGQETKTWGDTVEYVRGTVAQGWSKTFELIFGNYETATKFFSSIVEDMYTVFVAGGDARNEFLDAWATGIRWDKDQEKYFQARQGVQVAFLNGLINTARGVAEIISKVRNAIFDLIPDSVLDTVMDLTLMFHQWSITFAESLGVEKIARSLEFVNDIADDLVENVEEGGVAISGVVETVGKVAEPTAEILAEVNELAKAVIRGDYGNGATRIEKLGNKFKMVQNRVNELLGCTYQYSDALEEWMQTADSATESIDNMTNAQEESGESAERTSNIFKNLVSVIKGFKSILDIAWTTITSVARFVMDKITPGLAKVSEGLLGVGGTLGDLLERFAAFIKDNDLIYTALTTLYEAVQDKLGPAFEAVGKFMDDLSARKGDVLGFFESLDFSNIGNVDIQTFFKNLRASAGGAISTIGNLALRLGVGAANLLGFNVSLDKTQQTFGSFVDGGERRGIGGFIQSLKALGGNIGKDATGQVSELAKAGGVLKEYWDMVLSNELSRKINSLLISFGSIFQLFGAKENPIKTYFETTWQFGKEAKTFGAFLDEVNEGVPLLSTVSRILKSFKDFFKLTWDVLSAIGTSIINGFKKWFNPFVDFLKNIVEKVKSIDLDSLLQIGVLVTVLGTLLVVLRLMAFAGSMFKSFSWVGDELYSLLRSMVVRNYAGVLLEFAISFGIVLFALAKLVDAFNQNSAAATQAIIALVVIFMGLIGLMIIMTKLGKSATAVNSLMASGSLLMIISTLGLVIAEIYVLAKMNQGNLYLGIVRLWAVFAAVGMIMAILNALFTAGMLPDVKQMASFFVFMMSLKTAADILASLAGYSWPEMAKGLLAMVAIAGIITTLSYAMRNIKVTSSVGLISLVGAIWLFVKFLQIIKDYDFAEINRSLLKLTPIFLTILALGAIAKMAGNGMWAISAVLISIAFSLRGIVNAVKILGEMKQSQMYQGLAGLSAILGVMAAVIGGLIYLLSFVELFALKMGKSDGNKLAVMFIGLGVAMLAIAGAMKIIASIDKDKIWTATLVLTVLMVAFGALAKLAQNLQAHVAPILALAAVLVVIALSLWGLSNIPWDKLLSAAGALASVLGAFGYAIGQLGKTGGANWKSVAKQLVSLVLMALVFGEIAFALSKLAVYDPIRLGVAAGAMTLLMGVLIGGMKVLGSAKSSSAQPWNVVKGIALQAAPAILAMVGVATAMAIVLQSGADPVQIGAAAAAIIAVLGFLFGVFFFIKKNALVLNLSGGVHLGVLGGLLVEFAGFTIGLIAIMAVIGEVSEAIDANLNGFVTNGITKFFDLIILIAKKLGEAVSAIGEGLTARAPQMGDNLAKFAKSMKDFISVFNDASVDWGRIANASFTLHELMVDIAGASHADVDSEKLKTNVTNLGSALKDFYTSVNSEDINVTKAKQAAEALGILTSIDVASTSYYFSDLDFETIADGLSSLGRALASFSESMSSESFDLDAVTSGLTAVQKLADIAKNLDLSNFSGWDALIGLTEEVEVSQTSNSANQYGLVAGIETTTKEVTALSKLADELINLSDQVKNKAIDETAVMSVISCIGALADVAQKVPNAGGLLQEFLGGFSWTTLSGTTYENGLARMGAQISAFAGFGSVINLDNFEIAATALERIVEIVNTLSSGLVSISGENFNFNLGQNSIFNDFVECLPSLTTNLLNFYDTFKDKDATKLGPAFTILRRLASIPQVLTDNGLSADNISLLDVGYQLEDFCYHFANAFRYLSDLVTGEDAIDSEAVGGLATLLESIGAAFTPEVIESFASIGTTIQESIVSAFETDENGTVQLAVDGFKTLLNMKLTDAEFETLMKTIGHGYTGKLAWAMRDSESQKSIETQMFQVVSHIVNALNNKQNMDRMIAAGEHLADGLVTGVKNREGELRAAGAWAADMINQGFIGVEHIFSPSRVWFEYGGYLIAGLANGMDDSADDAIGAAKNLASTLNGEFTNTLGSSITPVIDLSTASRQAGDLGAMLDTSRAAAIAASMNINSQVTQMDQLVNMTSRILGAVQDGSDLYLDDGILAGRINRRLGVL